MLQGARFTNIDTLISARISNHMPNKVYNEITYPFPNLTVESLTFGNR